MSVSLLEVIEAAGYDLNTVEDANWLLSNKSEFEYLLEEASNLIEEDVENRDEDTSDEYLTGEEDETDFSFRDGEL
jgi:hypothetical protein